VTGRRTVLAAAVALAAAALVALAVQRVRSPSGAAAPATTAETTTAARLRPVLARPRPKSVALSERVTGALPAPLQDPSAAVVGRRVILLGGLTAADTSSGTVLSADAGSARSIGALPSARHDTAAATIGGSVYLFGGGNGVAQLDDIVRIEPESGSSKLVGHLPAGSSDSSAAVVGGTAYIVGGYTGARWLDTIVAWRPGSGGARVVAHLPQALRYAAVAAAGDHLVIAGGSLEDGSAGAAVLEFTPATNRVTRLGTLPAPTTHAAAAAIGGVVYVIGGRGATPGSATARIVAVDLRTGRVRAAGRLAVARSDLAAAAVGGRILVAGGAAASGTVATLSLLESAPARVAHRHSIDYADVYAHDGANQIALAARDARPLVYVPNSKSDSVDVIDPHTFKIVEHFPVGGLPQHVVPAWDLKTLYVTNDTGNSLTTIDPRTGKPGRTIPVEDPYNMYFTPDGKYAIVVAERLHRLDFRDAHTFALHRSVDVPCRGVDHMDFSADETYLIASCEFSGQMIKVDLRSEKVVGVLDLPDGPGGMPQDVKLSPDGRTFYVADMMANGLYEIDGARFKVTGYVRTGGGVHGLYPSRDGTLLYATNRGEGSISVLDFRTRKVVHKWWIPGGGSPDMGGVSADGKVLWLSGRYNGVVYAISTRNGKLLAKIPVGSGPHGLCVWPQPGRYSLGHTGILR
jgi:YVTN family beta-propeller protein